MYHRVPMAKASTSHPQSQHQQHSLGPPAPQLLPPGKLRERVKAKENATCLVKSRLWHNSSSGVCVGGQTDGYSAEELEAGLSLYNGNNQQSGKKMGFSLGQSPNSGEETVETSFMGTAQI
ncbi:hypothetical protein DUI87_26808 [Hirundo rustica rustica]|uniref:Uncharacterized protein n=1 Tax=Hirundo rustica rustica TaxID=333673 RepID=A0A3M0J7C7_HIRRU|nr:hypothetical protein DUI87_26808 [Hirundo rustica rustica]